MASRTSIEIPIQRLFGQVEAQTRYMVRAVHAHVVRDTPVRTGWAAANWEVSIGPAPSGVRPNPNNFRYGVSAGAIARVRAQEVKQAQNITTVPAQWSFRMPPMTLYNLVPYIRRLDNGSSRQAPAGFVAIAIRKGIAQTQRKFSRF
jgi:hypothetical protein